MMALTGLKDDYVDDGRVLVEDLDHDVLPPSIKNSLDSYLELAKAHKDFNATKEPLGVASLVYANRSITRDDATYAAYIKTIDGIAKERDALAGQMIEILNGAEFDGKSVRDAGGLVEQANKFVARVQALAAEHGHH